MKRDLFLTLDFPPSTGGIARYSLSLLRVFGKRRCIVLAPRRRDTTEGEVNLPPSITLRRRQLLGPPWIWPRWMPLLVHTIWETLRSRITLLHVGQLLPVGTVALFLHWLFGVPYIVYVHGLDLLSSRKMPRKKALAQKILRSAERIVANSESTARLLREDGVTRDRLLIVRPGCTMIGVVPEKERVAQLQHRYHLEGKTVLLTIARLVERKGIDVALRSFSRLAPAYPNAVYVIVGEGDDRQRLERCAQENGVAERVLFLGKSPESDLAAWYALCSLFLLVPHSNKGEDIEGFGIVYLEAAAFGKPVIASRTGGVAEAVVDQQTGLLVPPEDEKATEAALRALLDHPERAQLLGANGKRRVEAEGRWEQRTAQLRRWLEEKHPQA
ncbi:MAG: glycosyltransferase family 4 protein [bacterium]